MKKLFLISLLVCMGILQSLAAAFDYTDERGVTWCCSETDWNEETQSYTSAYIYSAIGYGNEVVIPEKVYNGTKEYTVTSIGAAFEDNETVEKVTLPSTFTTIASCTFQRCTNLKVVENIRQVTEIKNDAFNGCVSLIALDLGSCKIGWSAFDGCSNLQSIGESAKCTSVDYNAFRGCSSLEKIDLSMCTSVDFNAFSGCSRLQSIGNPKLTFIPNGAFEGCSSLDNIDLSMCTSVGSSAFSGCLSLDGIDLSLCTSVGYAAFRGCSKLQNVNTSNCTYIGDLSFEGCSSLENIDLSLCTSVGMSAFRGCSKLQNVNISNCTYIGSSAFEGCSSITEVDLSACKKMDDYAFNGCKKLENVIGLENFKSIPNCAFGETALKSVELPACTAIGSSAFEGCIDLQSVDLPKVESLGSHAFWKSGITKISLSGTLKDMGYACFDKVTEYTFNGTQPAALSKVDENPLYAPLYGTRFVIRVPESAIDTYKTADIWKNYTDKIFSISDQLYYDVTTTAMDSQSGLEQAIGATNMKKVISLKATGTINGYDIFMIRTKMTHLQDLDLTDADIVANGFAYYENNSTTNNVVGDKSFYKLDNLVTLKLPKNAVTIGYYAVASCSSLESVVMG